MSVLANHQRLADCRNDLFRDPLQLVSAGRIVDTLLKWEQHVVDYAAWSDPTVVVLIAVYLGSDRAPQHAPASLLWYDQGKRAPLAVLTLDGDLPPYHVGQFPTQMQA